MSYQCSDSTLQIGILLMPNPVKGRVAENLAVERARNDRLAAGLAEARKGWLERLLEAVRRK
jgi:hypothetical protein